MQLHVRAMETYHIFQNNTIHITYKHTLAKKTMLSEYQLNSYGVICEEIERSRESERYERLVEILSAMLQILHIGERVLSETNKGNRKPYEWITVEEKIEEHRVFWGTKLTRLRRQIEKVAAEKRDRVREIETEKNVNRDSRSFTLRSKSPSVGGIVVRVRKSLCWSE